MGTNEEAGSKMERQTVPKQLQTWGREMRITRRVCLPCMVLMHSKLWKSHSLMVMSAEHDASSLPVRSKEMSCTESVWPFSVRSKSPVS